MCVFCKIINGEIPCFKVYEDDFLLGFLDVNPDCNGHTLIVPKKHILDIDEMDGETFKKMLEVSKKLKKEFEDKLNINGLTLVQNNGEIQEVKHFHLHLKPFYKNKMGLLKVEDVYNIMKGIE